MVKAIDVVNEVCYLANRGIGVNPDSVYGSQCVDLINHIMIKFFGIRLWGNAIDLLDSASEHGLFIKYNALDDINPKAGDVFVMDTRELYGHPFGHTGVVIEDSDGYTIKTVEQNIDGNADALEVGGPARFNTRSFAGIVGWFRPNYEESTGTETITSGWIKDENGWTYEGTPANQWKKIDEAWYYFNEDGYALSDQWLKYKDKWYWLKSDCAMALGWHKINNKWYFFDNDGSMHEGWIQYFEKWYYLNPSDGDMVSRECRNINGDWYYFNGNGEMLEKANITVDETGAVHFE